MKLRFGGLLMFLFTVVMGKEKAILEIVIHRSGGNGEYITEVERLVGHFSSAGPTLSAEGAIIQVSGRAKWEGPDPLGKGGTCSDTH